MHTATAADVMFQVRCRTPAPSYRMEWRRHSICRFFDGAVHKRTDSHPAACQDRYTPIESGENHMLFIVGVVIALIAVVIIPRMWVLGGVNSSNLGWMSQQWLAEHRASHSL